MNPENTEELPELPADLQAEVDRELGQTQDLTHTVLEIWASVLSNIEANEGEHISPRYANSIVSNWPRLSFQEVSAYTRQYFTYLKALREQLTEVIAQNPSALENVENDAEANREHYLELIGGWQEQIEIWELNWDSDDHGSHISLAALADATSFFVGAQGLVEHLTQIGFQFTDEDREALRLRLLAVKGGVSE
jgi:uncharacterized protein with von Willebrand factor type A (vWA) domain